MNDRDVTAELVNSLNAADAIVAFFANLGYGTNARAALQPSLLGITTHAKQVRRIERLADQEGLLQVYLVETVALTLGVTRALAQAFRSRAGHYLLVLTSDYERIDFVLLEKKAPQRQPGGGMTLRQVNVKPRVLSVNRREPNRVQLRVLRRLTYSEADPLAQYEKLCSAFDVADWSEEHFNNRALFSDHFLLSRVPDLPAWAEDPKPSFRAFRALYENAAARFSGLTTSAVQSQAIEPALKALGFDLRPSSQLPRPDYLLHSDAGEPLAACLAYPWGRYLDGGDPQRDRDRPGDNPGALVVSLLEQGQVPYAIVTNGKHWRLYATRAHSRATNYYEIDVEETLALDDPAEAFRYFWVLFRGSAFTPTTDGTSFLDAILDGSERYAKQLGESLRARVFEHVFGELAGGFLHHLREPAPAEETLSQDELDAVFRATLTFLYRVLFILYSEARSLLPVREISGYRPLSLTQIKEEIALAAGPIEDESTDRIARHYQEDSTALYDRLQALFRVVDRGDTARNVPAYNGGLFRSDYEANDEAAGPQSPASSSSTRSPTVSWRAPSTCSRVTSTRRHMRSPRSTTSPSACDSLVAFTRDSSSSDSLSRRRRWRSARGSGPRRWSRTASQLRRSA